MKSLSRGQLRYIESAQRLAVFPVSLQAQGKTPRNLSTKTPWHVYQSDREYADMVVNMLSK